MSIAVEHDKRRYEILEKALDAFMDEGFEDVTFQKIADRCGITRTTLYIYFKNKREIFNFSIKQFLSVLENNINDIRKSNDLSHTEKLVRVMIVILERLEENRRLLLVIMNSLVYMSKGEHAPDYRVRRRTVRMRHIMTTMLIDGIKTGEFTPKLNVKDANELLYGVIEAAIFRMVVLRRESVEELKDAVKQVMQRFAAKEANGL